MHTPINQKIYKKASTTIKIYEPTKPIHVKRSVVKGETISSKLFN